MMNYNQKREKKYIFAIYFENKGKNYVFFFKKIKILNLSLRLQKQYGQASIN
jgi:hypothetical protein